MMDSSANIPLFDAPFLRPDGRLTDVWYQFLLALFQRTGGMNAFDATILLPGVDVPSPASPLEAPAAGQDIAAPVMPDCNAPVLPEPVMPAPAAAPFVDASMIMALASAPGTQATAAVTLPTSPATYTATARQAIHIAGGTVTALSYSRGPTSMALAVAADGQLVEMDTHDTLTITYSAAPTVTRIPR